MTLLADTGPAGSSFPKKPLLSVRWPRDSCRSAHSLHHLMLEHHRYPAQRASDGTAGIWYPYTVRSFSLRANFWATRVLPRHPDRCHQPGHVRPRRLGSDHHPR